MVTFRLGAGIGNEIEVHERGILVRGPTREDILQIVETGKQILRIRQPGTFRVSLVLSYDEKLALASALKQAAVRQLDQLIRGRY